MPHFLLVEDNLMSVESRGRGCIRTGKYACACGEACKCGTISQKPGKCACGVDLNEVKAD